MELRVLRYFLMVAREENITKAANLLHVTQPTLSRQLMQLEEELGVKLFHRSRHRILLSEEGMLLKRRAQELVDLADKTLQEFSQEASELAGKIAVGSGELQSTGVLAEILTAFHKQHPQIHYELFSADADGIKERLENGLLDFGLLLEPVNIQTYEFIRMPVKEQWGVLVRKDSLLAGKAAVQAEDLIHTELIASGRDLIVNDLGNWFGEYADQIDVVVHGNLLYNMAMMVEQGLGSALCLKLDTCYQKLCFRPFTPALTSGSVLVWKKAQRISPMLAAFIKFSKAYVERMVQDGGPAE